MLSHRILTYLHDILHTRPCTVSTCKAGCHLVALCMHTRLNLYHSQHKDFMSCRFYLLSSAWRSLLECHMTCFLAGRSMPAYLRWLKQKPSTESAQLAASCLLQFLFLLLHTLQASEQYLCSSPSGAQANISIRPDQSLPGLPSQPGSNQLLPNLEHDAVGDLTCADARWCPPSTVLRRIGEFTLQDLAVRSC